MKKIAETQRMTYLIQAFHHLPPNNEKVTLTQTQVQMLNTYTNTSSKDK